MADRNVVWRIATDFAKARRDADKLADSLDRLSDQTEELDGKTTAGGKKAAAASRERSKAVKESAAQQRVASREDQSATRTTTALTGATKTFAAALKRRAAATRANVAATRQQNVVDQQAVPLTAAVAAAQERVAKATLSREKAALALEAAQRRLIATEKSSGQSSQEYSNALLSVERRQLDVRSSTAAQSKAMAILDRATVAAAASAAGGASAFGRLAGALKRGGNSFANAPVSLGKMGASLGMMIPKIALITTGIGYLITAVSALSAGVVGLLGPLGQLGGVLAALPQMATVAAGAIGTMLAAFSGIGEALKAGTEAQAGAAQAAADTAKAEKAAARGIKMAIRGVRDAREAAADSARNYARALKDASEAVKDAKEAEIEAGERLHEVRQEARRDLIDMQANLRDLALAERGAAISVEEARRKLQTVLADPAADALAKQSAQLAYDEALAQMSDVEKEKARADKDTAEAVKKGVKGTESVVDAREAELEAAEAVKDAEQALADTKRDAARAARDSAEAIADAQYNLAQAYEAAEDASKSGAAAMDKYNEALENLSPAGRKFVETLMNLKDELKRLKFAAQEGLLPGLGEALVTMTKLVPLAERGFFMFGQTIGNVAKKAADMLTSDAFMPMWERLLVSNNKLLELGGDAFLNLLEAVVYLMDAAAPFTEWLSETIVGWTQYWKEIAKAGNETGRTADFLDRTKWVLETLGGAFANLWQTFKNLSLASRDFSRWLLKGFEDITKGWADWTGSIKGQNELKEWFESAKKPLSAMSSLLGALTRMIFDLGRKNGDDLAYLLTKFEELVPLLGELMSNLQGDFGTALVDMLASVMEILITLTGGSSGGLTSFVETLTKFADAINWLLQQKGVMPFLSGLGSVLGVLMALKFIGILTGLRGMFRLLRSLSGLGGGSGGGFFKKMGDGLKKFGSALKGAFAKALPLVKSGASAIGRAFTSIGGFIMKGVRLVGPALAKIGPFVMRMVGFFGTALAKIGPILMKIVGLVSKALLIIGRALLMNPWVLLIVALVAVAYLVYRYWDEIVAFVKKAVSAIIDFVKKNWNIIKWFLGPIAVIVTEIVKHWDRITEVFFDAVDAIGDFFTKTIPGIVDDFVGFFAAIPGQISDLASQFTSAAGDILDAILSGFSNGVNFAQDLAGQIYDAVSGAINSAIDSLNGILEFSIPIPGAPDIPINPPNLPHLPVLNRNRGGGVPGEGNRDSVPALLTPGEFVLRKDAVERIGVTRLSALNEGREKFAKGGAVGKGKKGKKKGKKDEEETLVPTVNEGKHLEKILGFLRGAKVEEKRYTGSVTLDKVATIGETLRKAYAQKPNRETLQDFLRANDMLQRSVPAGSGGLAPPDGGTYKPKPAPKPVPKAIPASSRRRVWPVPGRNTSTYPNHDGVDINQTSGDAWSDDGDPIWAADAGVVSYVGEGRGYGQAIFIRGPYGELVYGHTSSTRVRSGQGVAAGQQIGNVGNTGNSSAPHLHFGFPGGSTSGALAFLAGSQSGAAPSASPPVTMIGGKLVGNAPDVIVPAGAPGSGSVNAPVGSTANPAAPGQPPMKLVGKKYGFDDKLKKDKAYSLPNMLKYIGAHTFEEVRKKFDMTGQELVDLVIPNRKAFKELGPKSSTFMTGFKKAKTRLMGPDPAEAPEGGLDANGDPIDNSTPLEREILKTQGETAKQNAWAAALTNFAMWGFQPLVDDALEKGMDDEQYYASIIDASDNRDQASQLNDVIKERDAFSADDLAPMLKMITAFNTAPNEPTLRDIARATGTSDLQTVLLFEKLMTAGKLGGLRTGRVSSDVASYRAGTFYANTGGQVPGAGNTDSVPSMLTPGEFVVRKEAAKALGLKNLWALNNAEKFASGGLVMAPTVGSVPTNAAGGVSARVLQSANGAGNTYSTTYDIDIINPIAEEGTRSMLKALQRQSAIGGGSTIGKNNA